MNLDDIVESWGAEYEAAWKGPGRVPSIGFNDMEHQPDRLEIVQLINRFPAPFHMGFGLGDTKETSGADGAALMLDIRVGRQLADDAKAKRDAIAKLCDASGMSISRWHVCTVGRTNDGMRTTLYVEIMALNAAGATQPHDMLVGDGYGRRGMDKIRKLAGTQKARRATAEAPLTTDPILLRALRRLPRYDLERLQAHLRQHPTVPVEEMGLAMQANWDRPSLARYGCRLPDGVETIIVKKGVISGRVRLAPGTTWTGGTLVHAAGLPDTLAVGIVGRRLDEVVAHPDIDPRMVVRTAVIDKRNALRITTQPLLEAIGAA